MIESPVFEIVAALARQRDLVMILKVRFGDVPPEFVEALRPIEDPEQLDQLVQLAATCPDLDAFRAALPT